VASRLCAACRALFAAPDAVHVRDAEARSGLQHHRGSVILLAESTEREGAQALSLEIPDGGRHEPAEHSHGHNRPTVSAMMKPGTSEGRIPAKVSVSARAIVTAGFAKSVAVNQKAPPT
jgi:hypothetical protein